MGGYTWYSVWIAGVWLGLFATSLMWTDEVGRWLFEMSIISCSIPLSGHRRHIITIFLVLEFGFFFFLLESFGKSEG